MSIAQHQTTTASPAGLLADLPDGVFMWRPLTCVLAIDPGPLTSGAVVFSLTERRLLAMENEADNLALLQIVERERCPVVCEGIQNYGGPVGASVFDSLLWIGEFRHACGGPAAGPLARPGGRFYEIKRPEVGVHLCNNRNAKPSHINQAIRNRFYEWTGIHGNALKGPAKNPGPLYGVKDHIWSALAVAIAYAETEGALIDLKRATETDAADD